MPPRRPSFYAHIHPPTIPAREARFTYTFGLGGISLLLFFVVGVTGVLEMFFYVPTTEGAYESVQLITHMAPYGWLLRNMHFWSGQLMVGTVILHMARVVFSGGYKARRLNWLIGIGLLVLTLVLDFTGYVLRWDQDTSWALMVGTNLLKEIPGIGPAVYRFAVGGRGIGEPAILRFFTWHVFGLVLPAVILVVWHLFRVRRDGGISHRERSPRVKREELIRIELTAAGMVMAALIGLCLLFDAPLGPPADPAAFTADPQAPWFFVWIQEMLRVLPPFLAGILIPLLVLVLLGIMPYSLDRHTEGVGEWFNRPGRLAQSVFLVLLILIVALTVRGISR
jgi:quinol-cytochrome oxidoreductase complex cytochrome b subunit